MYRIRNKYLIFVMVIILLAGLTACQTNNGQEAGERLPQPQDIPFTSSEAGVFDYWWSAVTPIYADYYAISTLETGGPNGETALHIHSTVIPGGSDNYGTVARLLGPLDQYRGHRVRISADIKSEGVTGWAGLWFRVDGAANRMLAFDNMRLRPVVGDNDWRRHEVVLDVPAVGEQRVDRAVMGFLLNGPGQVWVSNFRIEAVSKDTPLTDTLLYAPEPLNLDFEMSENGELPGWQIGGSHPWLYAVGADDDTAYAGRQSGAIHADDAPPYAWVNLWQQVAAEPYHGQQIQFSAFVKLSDVRGEATLSLKMEGQRSTVEHVYTPPLSGASDWQPIELTLDLDEGTETIFFEVRLTGPGQLWIDEARLEGIGPSNFDEAAAVAVRQKRTFTALWELFNGYYIYPDFNGLDWTAVFDTYMAQIEEGMSNEQFWAAMKELVASLDDQHSFFETPQDVAWSAAVRDGQPSYGGIGVMASLTHNEEENEGFLVVHYAFSGSPADAAGLQPRDRILAVNGEPVCCAEDGRREDLILGTPGTAVTLTVQSPGQEPREVNLTRTNVVVRVPIEARRLEGNIGYIQATTLNVLGIAEDIEAAWLEINEAGPLNGLILDLRLNAGGYSSELEKVLGLFTDGKLGEYQSRHGQRDLVVNGRDMAGSQTIPLVVLISGLTNSNGEVLAGALQEAGRAVLVGQPTRANVETVSGFSLPDRSQVTIAIELFSPPSGADYNVTGVLPDIAVSQHWYETTGDADDEALIVAWEWLRGR
jgi:C-terminal peptidase prc